MKLYRIDVKIYGTAYIQAESEFAALEKLRALKGEISVGDSDIIYGDEFHTGMPAVSLSPAMTVHGAEAGTVLELVEETLPEGNL